MPQPIKNDPYLQQFLEERELKNTTKTLYISIINNYCTLHQKTPTQFIEEAINEEDQQIRKPQRTIRKYLTQYRQHLQTKNYSHKTVKAQLTVIRSFYNEYEIELPKSRLKNKHPETLTTSQDIPGKTHIKCVLKHCNFKYKAVIYLMLESGMGSAEIRSLTLKDFINSTETPILTPFSIGELHDKLIEKHVNILTWKIKRIKTDKPYFTFSGPDSITAIIDYLQQKYKSNPLPLTDYLFGKNVNPSSRRAIIRYFNVLNSKCEFGSHGRHNFFTSHKLRKYFATTLESSRMPHLMIRWLMGHSIDSVTNAYFKPDIEALKMEYRRVLPYLSINKVEVHELSTDEARRLNMLEKELKETKEAIDMFKSMQEEVKDLKK